MTITPRTRLGHRAFYLKPPPLEDFACSSTNRPSASRSSIFSGSGRAGARCRRSRLSRCFQAAITTPSPRAGMGQSSDTRSRGSTKGGGE